MNKNKLTNSKKKKREGMDPKEEKYLKGLSIQELKWISRQCHLKSSQKKEILVAQILKYAGKKGVCGFNYNIVISQLKKEKRFEKLKVKKQLEKKELLDHLRTHLQTTKLVQLEKILNEFYKSKYKI